MKNDINQIFLSIYGFSIVIFFCVIIFRTIDDEKIFKVMKKRFKLDDFFGLEFISCHKKVFLYYFVIQIILLSVQFLIT